MHCEPATSIITKLGGLTAVSAIVGKSTTTVMRWRLPRKRGGTGGVIPHWHHKALIAAGKQANPPLRASDFICLDDADLEEEVGPVAEPAE